MSPIFNINEPFIRKLVFQQIKQNYTDMKKCMLLFFLFPITLFGQKVNEQIVKSDIKKIKLFLTAGEMLHEQSLKLVKGRNKIIFSGISTFADPESIQFSATGNYHLVSVSTEMDFLAAEQFNPRIIVLKDSLELLKDLKHANEDQIDAYNTELDVLNVNKNLKGSNQNITVAQIKEASEFFRIRTLEINQKLTKLNKDESRLKSEITKMRSQLVELNYNENQRSNQVIIILDVDTPTTINSTLKYLVSDCGWAAMYDLSATDLNQKVNLKYKAQIYNNTGNNWNDIDLVLSTGDPRLSASHPELNPWYLEYVKHITQYSYISKTPIIKGEYQEESEREQDYRENALLNIDIANQRAYDNYYIEGKDDEISSKLAYKPGKFDQNIQDRKDNLEQGNTGAEIRQIEISELTAEFVIANKFSCPSDAKPYIVEVKEMNLDATFSHISVPKLDNGSFLLANIVGWQELELIPGPTNVYFGGEYVGVSEIETHNVEDTLSLSFGRDNKVIVLRKLKKEMSEKRIVGNSKKDSYVYEIAVRNNRTVPIKINLYDQVPISKNSDIVVSVDNISKAKKDDTTGETLWEITLQPGEVQTVELAYSIKYPKEAKIAVNQYRKVDAYKF